MKEEIIEAEQVPTQALAVRPEQSVVNPLDLEPGMFKSGLDRRKENRKNLIEWVRQALVEGVDFGRIPTKRGPSKPSLWKPGAEKICGMLGVTPTFPTLKDFEAAALSGVEIKSIIMRCEIVNSSGGAIAHGVGARSVEQDYGDINKALKMAEKSAHIDATLRMAGLSEIFTQDIEDMPKVAEEQPKPKPAPAAPTTLKMPTASTRDWMIGAVLARPDQANRKMVTEYFKKVGQLLPNEQVEDLPLRFVPYSKAELTQLHNCLGNFESGGDAVRAFEPHGEPDEPKKKGPPPESTEPPGGWQGATGGEEDDLPSCPMLKGAIEHVSLKEGKSKKGGWSLWGIKINGTWANTFSNTVGKMAQDNKGQEVTLYYEEGEKGNKVVELVLADGTRHKVED